MIRVRIDALSLSEQAFFDAASGRRVEAFADTLALRLSARLRGEVSVQNVTSAKHGINEPGGIKHGVNERYISEHGGGEGGVWQIPPALDALWFACRLGARAPTASDLAQRVPVQAALRAELDAAWRATADATLSDSALHELVTSLWRIQAFGHDFDFARTATQTRVSGSPDVLPLAVQEARHA